jgi:hypothetical protein
MLRGPDSGPPAGPKYEAAIRGQMDLVTCGSPFSDTCSLNCKNHRR